MNDCSPVGYTYLANQTAGYCITNVCVILVCFYFILFYVFLDREVAVARTLLVSRDVIEHSSRVQDCTHVKPVAFLNCLIACFS